MIFPMFPFLLLVTALISAFLYQRTNQEIHLVLAVASAIVCLLWGLVISHWSIHLISLLALLFLRNPILKTVEIYNDNKL